MRENKPQRSRRRYNLVSRYSLMSSHKNSPSPLTGHKIGLFSN